MKSNRGRETSGRVQSMGNLVGQLMSRRGYASVAEVSQFEAAIERAVGKPLAETLRVGKLNRGVLRVFAPDSVTVQELVFQKRQILKAISEVVPDSKVSDLRFSVLTT